MKRLIRQVTYDRYNPTPSFDPSVHKYTQAELYIMRNIYLMFQTLGESELHIESLRQKLAKDKQFEPYQMFRMLEGSHSLPHDRRVNHNQLFQFIVEREGGSQFQNNFNPSDLTFTVNYHSSSKNGQLDFTDFNSMVLPTCNQKLRAQATQRNYVSAKSILEFSKNSRPEKKLVELLVAEACLNLDLEVMKMRLESVEELSKKKSEFQGEMADKSCLEGFSTELAFNLIDIRGFKYLDMEGIKIFMDQYFKHILRRDDTLYLDTRLKFLKAIMRRMGVDFTKKISFREFADFLKPNTAVNLASLFKKRGT
jgi:hypothetical protein